MLEIRGLRAIWSREGCMGLQVMVGWCWVAGGCGWVAVWAVDVAGNGTIRCYPILLSYSARRENVEEEWVL